MKFWIRRLVIVGLVLAILAGIGFGIYSVATRDPGYRPPSKFVEGFHNARTGEPLENMMSIPEVSSPDTWIVVIVEFSISCSHCHAYVEEVAEAWIQLDTAHPGRVVFVLVAVDESSDKDIVGFLKQHGIPDTIPVCGGVGHEHASTGVPETIVYARNPLMDPNNPDAWGGVTNFLGRTGADVLFQNLGDLIKVIEKYVEGK